MPPHKSSQLPSGEASVPRAGVEGIEPAIPVGGHASELKIYTLVANLPGAELYRVSAVTGRPGISTLCLVEIEILIRSFYLTVAVEHVTGWDLQLLSHGGSWACHHLRSASSISLWQVSIWLVEICISYLTVAVEQICPLRYTLDVDGTWSNWETTTTSWMMRGLDSNWASTAFFLYNLYHSLFVVYSCTHIFMIGLVLKNIMLIVTLVLGVGNVNNKW